MYELKFCFISPKEMLRPWFISTLYKLKFEICMAMVNTNQYSNARLKIPTSLCPFGNFNINLENPW